MMEAPGNGKVRLTMGVLGTGAVTGVAQVGLQAQQSGGQQARRTADRAHVLQRQKEVRETRLKGLVEDDRAAAETDLHVDGELPDPDRHPDTARERAHDEHPQAQGSSAPPPPSDDADEPVTYTSPLQPQHQTPPALQHRLDVEA